MTQIIAPLENEKDEIHIISSDPKIKTNIKFRDKKKMNQSLKKLKEQIPIEIHEEEFFGYLSEVDIDKGKFCFTLEETEKHIPTIFDKKPNLNEIRKILGLRLKIKAIVTRKEGTLEKLEIKYYNLKERKNLMDF